MPLTKRICFIPSRITEAKNCFEIISFDPKNLQNGIQFTPFQKEKNLEINWPEKVYLSLLKYFEHNYFLQVRSSKQQSLSLSLQGEALNKKLNAITRNHIYNGFDYLQRHFDSLLFYSRIELPEKNPIQKDTTIYFRKLNTKIKLIKGEDYAIRIKLLFDIDGNSLEEGEYHRFGFFIYYDKDLYMIRHAHFNALEFIRSHISDDLRIDYEAFAQKIIKPNEFQIEILTDEIFTPMLVKADPSLCIHLSESQGFLNIVPSFVYDYFIKEVNDSRSMIHYTGSYALHYEQNEQIEKRLLDDLIQSHEAFQAQKPNLLYLTIEQAKNKNWFLHFYHRLLDQGIRIEGMELLRHFRYSPFPIETRFDVIDKKDAPLCAVKLEVRFGTNIIPNKELQKTIMNRQKFVMLQDETMGVLPDDWLEDYGLIIKHLIFEAEHIWLNKFLLIFSNQSKHAQLFQNLDLGIDIAQWKDKWAQYQNNPTTQIAIENYVNADLRPYQAKGVEWMVLISEVFSGALLSDDMGLGKTIQTITFLGYMNLKHPGKHLIIAPAGLMYNWKKELENFGIGLSSYVYHRQDRNISSQEFHEAKAIITSYQTARADIDNLAMIQWNTIVLDESHYIKNPAAQTTKAILQLQAKMKILLSGTPVMNSTMDLYPQYEFIMPNFFANESFFRKEYADPIDIHRDENKIKQLQKISSFINLRRTKEKVLDELPEKTESILYCDMGETQRKLYDLIKKSIKEKVIMDIKEKGIGASKLGVLEAIQKLRIVCSDPSNIQEFSIQTQESIKIDLLMDQIRDILHQSKQHGLSNLELAHNVAVKNKIIVFSQFLNTLSVIKKRLEDDKIPYYFFDGSVAQEKRQELVNKFQDDSNRVPVFVISLKSGNMGITLTKANYVFLIDPWWNKFIEQQAIDRVYRIGQKEKVFAYRLICRDTIEERIIQLQERKLKLQEDLIQEDEGFIKNLSVDDIDFLFA